MSKRSPSSATFPRWFLPAVVSAATCLAITMSLFTLASVQPPTQWLHSIRYPETDLAALVFSNVALPRTVISWLLGIGLALSGVILQQILQNPIADTTTVGISAGAYLALAAAALWAPSLLNDYQSAIALLGSIVAGCLVLVLARRERFSSSSVVIGGLTINLLFGAAGAALTVLNHDYLSSLSIWQSGSLVQNGWGTVEYLIPRILIGMVVLIVLKRPFAMLALGDDQARSTGLKITTVRMAGLSLAAALGAFCVCAVGIIGFVGLMAPQVARMLGARTLTQRLVWAPFIGALLLWITDQCVQLLRFRQEISTGVATALTGSLFLLVVLLRRRPYELTDTRLPGSSQTHLRRRVVRNVVPIFLLLISIMFALGFGRTSVGWEWLSPIMSSPVLPWRIPRVIAAGSAGAMLAVSGSLLQRMTGNPMASPEVLGISSGGALGVIILLFFVSGYSDQLAIAASGVGALITLIVLFLLAWRAGFSADRLLLVGISLATLLGAFSGILLTSGDPRAAILLTWMSGSTYRVTLSAAYVALAISLACIPLSCLLGRWLILLSLGGNAARSVGVNLIIGRSAVLLMAGVLTGSATMIVGPLTFTGLIAPHLARTFGNRKPIEEILAAAAIGSVLLVTADWLGRNIVFPWQIPSGLVSTIIGAPCFLWLMRRRRG